jgi:hypothetical protein
MMGYRWVDTDYDDGGVKYDMLSRDAARHYHALLMSADLEVPVLIVAAAWSA